MLLIKRTLDSRQGRASRLDTNINNDKIEAAVFRRLLTHLRENTDLQNIDLMNLAGFCRNCISKWYMEASKNNGQDITYNKAKELIYNMPYEEWKKKFQK